MSHDPRLYVIHILECIGKIEEFTRDGRDWFFQSDMGQFAVLYALQTMAESTQRLPTDLKDRHPEVPWTDISGFRNVLAHDYLHVDIKRIWKIVEKDLPALKAAIQKIERELP